jgi:glycosyltransferase involved in cell wall biosynthesis
VRIGLIGPLPPELGGSGAGGVATHQAHLAAGLAALPDVDVSLLATNARGLPPLPYAATPLRERGLRPSTTLLRYAWRVRRADGSRRERLRQLVGYSQFLRTARPDIVHVQHPLERLRNVGEIRCLERTSWPIVVTAHSFFGEHEDAVIYGEMQPNLRLADRVIAVSPHIAEQAEQLGVERERIRVIRSGVDIDRYQPRDKLAARDQLGMLAEAQLILFVGNLEPRKQVDVLLRALSQMEDARLAIVGDGELRDALQKAAVQAGVAERACFTGRVDPETLMRWYAAADVFALPSSSEAQGIVALEAMASGLPVVASDVGGLRRTVEDGRTGFLVPAGDVQSLARRLAEVLSDQARARAMGQAARRSVEQHFSWTRAVEATASVYRELVP